jgi:hypothetical protein
VKLLVLMKLDRQAGKTIPLTSAKPGVTPFVLALFFPCGSPIFLWLSIKIVPNFEKQLRVLLVPAHPASTPPSLYTADHSLTSPATLFYFKHNASCISFGVPSFHSITLLFKLFFLEVKTWRRSRHKSTAAEICSQGW